MSDSTAAPSSLNRLFELSLIGLAAVGFAAIAVSGGVGPWTASAVIAAGAWRTGRAFGRWHGEPSRKAAALPAFLFLAFYPLDVALISGDFVAATVRLLLLFTALKLVIAKSPRDYLYLGLLGFLELLTASMFVEGVAFLLVLGVFLVFAMTAYAAYELRRGWNAEGRTIVAAGAGERLSRRLARTSVGLAAGVLLAGGALFLILPRPQAASGPMRSFDQTTVGFSNTVDLGQIGALKTDPTPLMRVESLDGSEIGGLYWRGTVLFDFDGFRWSAPGVRLTRLKPDGGGYGVWPGHLRRDGEGRRVRYRVKLEPLGSRALFLAGRVEEIRGQFTSLRISDVETLRAGQTPNLPRLYEALSWIPDRSAVQPTDVIELFSKRFRGRYLEHGGLDPRVAELADRVTEGEVYPLRKAETLEHFLRTEYGYTLDLPDKRAADPLAHFLFERREGHCEYFATAMAMMLRAEGIPSRLVNGFAGGVRSPLSGARVLRAADAHSWVEAYIPGYGWLEFDPTPPAPAFLLTRWGAELKNAWEAMQATWVEWIVGYDADNQVELARGLQAATRGLTLWLIEAWEALVGLLSGEGVAGGDWPALIGGFLLVGLSIWAARRAWRLVPRVRRAGARMGAAAIAYDRALRLLARRGFSRTDDQTAEEFQETIPDRRLRGLMRRITGAYNAARFGGDREAEARLPTLVDALERLG